MKHPVEYLNIYDHNGNLLPGKAIRGEKTDYLVGVVIIYIQNSKGEFLIQKTSPSRGSIYATTGGHVDYGKTFDETVINEVKEELGIDISSENVKEITTLIFGPYVQKVYYLKKDIDIKDVVIKEDEAEFVKWMSIDEIDQLIINNEYRNGNIEGFRKVLDTIEL